MAFSRSPQELNGRLRTEALSYHLKTNIISRYSAVSSDLLFVLKYPSSNNKILEYIIFKGDIIKMATKVETSVSLIRSISDDS